MDVFKSRRSASDSDSRIGLISAAVGLFDIGNRGLRVAFDRAVPGGNLVDLALGTALVGGELAARVTEPVLSLVRSAASRLPQPVRLPFTTRAMRVIDGLQQRGRGARIHDSRAVEQALDVLVPVIVEELLTRIDLGTLIRDHVDIESIVADLDLDAIVDTVDVDRVAKRLDLDAILDRLDLNAIVHDRVDLDAILDRLDLNAIVRDKVDLDAIVKSIDLDAVAARLDLDAIVGRLDLPVLAQNVIDEIDLPEIIRESSGSMASEAVRGVRMHSIGADDAVARALDRVLRHRHGATFAAQNSPVAPESPVAMSPAGITAPIGGGAPREVEQPTPPRS